MNAWPLGKPSGFFIGVFMRLLNVMFILLLLKLSTTAKAEYLIARVVGIMDGDTIEVLDLNKNRHKVRLAQIDAPEKAQPFGNRSKEYLSDLIYKKEVILDWQKKDRYDRLLAIVHVDKKNINYDMVINGYAWAYDRYVTDDIYRLAQQYAQTRQVGLWGHANPVAPWNWRRK